LTLTLRTPGSDVTAYTTVVAYRRASFGRRLLNDFCTNWKFSSNDSVSLIHTGGWRLRDCRLDEYSL
jgi:hypothetical protein